MVRWSCRKRDAAVGRERERESCYPHGFMPTGHWPSRCTGDPSRASLLTSAVKTLPLLLPWCGLAWPGPGCIKAHILHTHNARCSAQSSPPPCQSVSQSQPPPRCCGREDEEMSSPSPPPPRTSPLCPPSLSSAVAEIEQSVGQFVTH